VASTQRHKGTKGRSVIRRSLYVAAAVAILYSLGYGQLVYVYLPQETIAVSRHDTVQVPILIANQVNQGVISADITLTFPESLLTGTNVCRSGNAVPSGWMTYANPFSGEVLIAMAGADPLVSGDTLLVLTLVADSMDGFARIGFSRCQLNEGGVPCSTGYGQIQVPVSESRPGPLSLTELRIWPNPMRHSAALDYDLILPGRVSIAILDARGQVVRMLVGAPQMVGRHRLNWSRRDDRGTRLPAGVYFLTFDAPGVHEARKLILTE